MANLRLPGRSALTLAPPLSTTNIRARTKARPGNGSRHAFHADVTFDVLCPAWAERADRRPSRRTGSHVPRLQCRAVPPRKPGVGHHRSQVLVPPPVLYSQIPFPTEYPDGFTTFTPSIATTPCPHTSKTVPSPPPLLSRPVEDCEGCPPLAGARNLGLDDPRAVRPDSHCNFGDRSIRACRATAATQRKSRKRAVPAPRHCSAPTSRPGQSR